MKVIVIPHALEAEPLTIVAAMPVPEYRDMDDQAARFDAFAEEVVGALCNHLPRGITDRIAGKLMLKKATELLRR